MYWYLLRWSEVLAGRSYLYMIMILWGWHGWFIGCRTNVTVSRGWRLEWIGHNKKSLLAIYSEDLHPTYLTWMLKIQTIMTHSNECTEMSKFCIKRAWSCWLRTHGSLTKNTPWGACRGLFKLWTGRQEVKVPGQDSQLGYIYVLVWKMHSSREILYLPYGRSLEISRGRGALKVKILEGKYVAKLELFSWGREKGRDSKQKP